MSNVEKKRSAKPKAIIGGIHPACVNKPSLEHDLVYAQKRKGVLTASILHRPSTFVYLILFDAASSQVMHGTSGVRLQIGHSVWSPSPGPCVTYLFLEASERICRLLAMQDVEIVIGGMSACVTLCANGCAEDYKIFGDTGVDNVHATHSPAGVVEHLY